jgi:DNA polymerase III delta prime subunit
MDFIGSSSIWEHKFRPKTVNDLILPANIRKLFNSYVSRNDIPQLLFSSTAGRGKTSSAYALCHDLKSDMMYINGSIDNSIDTLRFKVTQYAMTSSFNEGKKICIIDECERLSPSAQDGMKGLMDQTESNCRFILTTNNVSKIIDPIISRGTHISFNFSPEETKNLIIAYFKRMCYVLDTEKVKYDKKIVAEFVQEMYPDFRKTIGDLQKCYNMFGEINNNIFKNIDGTQFTSLVEELKNKKFNSVRKIISEIDAETFYQTFYDQIDDLLDPTCMPTIVMILGQFAYESSLSISKEITLAACCTAIMKEARFK